MGKRPDNWQKREILDYIAGYIIQQESYHGNRFTLWMVCREFAQFWPGVGRVRIENVLRDGIHSGRLRLVDGKNASHRRLQWIEVVDEVESGISKWTPPLR